MASVRLPIVALLVIALLAVAFGLAGVSGDFEPDDDGFLLAGLLALAWGVFSRPRALLLGPGAPAPRPGACPG